MKEISRNKVDATYGAKNKTIAVILLVLTTIFWGSTFIITKTVIQEVPIFIYLGLRHLIALIGFLPFIIHQKKINKKVIFFGSLTGVIYFFSIVFQTFGLQTTTAGRAGFITGLSTVMVPFLMWLAFKRPLKKKIWIAVGLSILGMAILFLEGEKEILIGDILVLLCAFSYAIFIVLNDKYIQLIDVYHYTFVQLLVITLLCFGGSLLFKESYELTSTLVNYWFILIYMGFVCTTLISYS